MMTLVLTEWGPVKCAWHDECYREHFRLKPQMMSGSRTMLILSSALWDLLQDHDWAWYGSRGCRILILTNFWEKSDFPKGPRSFYWASQGLLEILVLLESLLARFFPSPSLSTAPDLYHHVKWSPYLVLSSLSNKSLVNVILAQCLLIRALAWHENIWWISHSEAGRSALYNVEI